MARLDLVRKANQLFLSKDYEQAESAYIQLLENNQDIDCYEFNLFMCRKRLGKSVSSYGLPSSGEVLNEVLRHGSVELFNSKPETDIVFLQADKFVLPLEKQIEKLLFYIAPMVNRVGNVYLFVQDASVKGGRLEARDKRLNEIYSKVSLLSVAEFDKGFVDDLVEGSVKSYIFHEKSIPESSVFDKKLLQLLSRKSGNIWRVHDDVQHHGSFLLKSLSDYFDSFCYQQQLKNKLVELRERNKRGDCYVFGTGPSLRYAYCIPEINESVVITCNSVVRNPTMLEFMKPDIVCATDPIFHAGWGKYAEEFRTKLLDSMYAHDFFLVVPHRDIHIYLNYLPVEFHHRIGCYEFESKIETLNFDLIASQKSAPKPNVLTNIMLPIAATIAKTIYVGGCDGKKDSSSYFWEHDKSSQLNNQMEDIKGEFKGFFDISYDNYYIEHCNTVKSQLAELKQNGYKVVGVTPSYIPALSGVQCLNPMVESLSSCSKSVSIVMPARNMASSIVSSVHSVLKSAKNAEESLSLFIINEGSSDDTVSLVNENFAPEIENGTIYIVNTIGLGVSCARNIGVALSESEYIGFLDADDLFSEDSLRVRISSIRNGDESLVGAFSKTKLVDIDSNEVLSVANDFGKNGLLYGFERVHSPAHISSILYKSDAIAGLTFPVGVSYGEDWLFLSRVLRGGGQIVFCCDSHTVYSIHAASVTKKSPEQHISALYTILDTIYNKDSGLETIGAKFEQGLSAIAHKSVPEYSRKITELTVRLVACYFVNKKTNASYHKLSSMVGKYPFNVMDTCLAENAESMKATFAREVRRFSGSQIVEKDVHGFLNRSKVAKFLPSFTELYRS
ncbi:glycosyltransferase [Shewanella sp. WXL01]|uniref:glycosyltransferase n=1 Tax=Shewanella sp. WXL01 TaxID=2709721 RepID=UPI00143861F5|nr:glycosyltransferase [Shewanella sp. WXL01]NKF50079.1 glycosyltransferase [Shewanella sp. WXL01]